MVNNIVIRYSACDVQAGRPISA